MITDSVYSTDLIIQYSVVGFVLLAALGWIVYKIKAKKRPAEGNSCCGCALSDNCKKKKK